MIGFDLVKQKGLKDIIAIKIGPVYYDLASPIIKTNKTIEFIKNTSKDGLEIIRHSCAHLLALAIQCIDKNTLFSIGPSIDDGFYYDIDKEHFFVEGDLSVIENKMNELVKQDLKFNRKEISKKEALTIFKKNRYKVEIINSLANNIPITIYQVGNFIDLCRGVHVPSTRYLKNFKLTKLAGAY
jgi:threonyl-tRNA synthetase